MENTILQEAKALLPYMQEVFYKIHSHPELGQREFQTQALVLAELEKMGIEATPIADTGVLGIIRGAKPGKTIAFRADMDALPIQEETDLPYASKVPNVMHACGHDSHVTILLGAAKMFQARKDTLCGNVKLFFQPDEEGWGGAKRMIEAGCMENPHVDAAFFGHVNPGHPTGDIGLLYGSASAASNAFTVVFRGKGTHGAQPHNGTDSIVAACQAVLALQTISSRRTNPTDSVVVTIGSFQAGKAGNVIPEEAVLNGMIRTLNPKTREQTKKSFVQILEGIAAAMDVQVDIDLREGYAATINDDAMTDLVRASAAKIIGEEHVRIIPKPGLGAEDFGYFLQEAPGCKYSLGIGNVEKGYTAPVHNPKFVVDTDGLAIGAAIYVQTAEDFLG